MIKLFLTVSVLFLLTLSAASQTNKPSQSDSSDMDNQKATSINWLKKSDKELKSGIYFNIAGAALIGGQFLIKDYGYDNVYVNRNGASGYEIQKAQDYTINYIMIAAGSTFTTVGIIQLYRSWRSYRHVTKTHNYSFSASPVGANVVFKF